MFVCLTSLSVVVYLCLGLFLVWCSLLCLFVLLFAVRCLRIVVVVCQDVLLLVFVVGARCLTLVDCWLLFDRCCLIVVVCCRCW